MPNNTKANRRYGRPPYAAVCVLESGGNRVNMLTQRFAFVPPCGASSREQGRAAQALAYNARGMAGVPSFPFTGNG